LPHPAPSPTRRSSDLVAEKDVASLDRNAQASFRNATIGFIFQNFNLVPVLTTLENVMLPAQLGRQDLGEPLADRAKRLLSKVGLDRKSTRLNSSHVKI